MRIFEIIQDLFSITLKPKDMEERYRIGSLPDDKTQITIVMILTLSIVLGFLGLDISYYKHNEVHLYWIPSRIVASIASLIAIWLVRRQSSPKRIDRITFVWGLVILLHMFVINLTRSRDYFSVIVWDILTISGIYFLFPISAQFKILTAFMLTGSSGVIWLISRVRLADPYQTIAVLAAYFFFERVWHLRNRET